MSGAPPPPPPPPPPLPAPPVPPPSVSSSGKPLKADKTSAKYTRFRWSKIPDQQIHNTQGTIWSSKGGSSDAHRLSVNLSTIQDLFEIKEAPKLRSPSPRGSKTASLNSEQKKQATILNMKQSMNINIFLRQFKRSVTDLVLAVRDCNTNVYPPESLKTLLKQLPEDDDLKKLQERAKEYQNLDDADKFVLELIQVPSYKLRVQCIIFMGECDPGLNELRESLITVQKAIAEIHECRALPEILQLVLQAGNFLNQGVSYGNAAGFRLNSLKRLVETKANKPGVTLMHYVAMELEKQNARMMNWPEQLPSLSAARAISVSETIREFEDYQKRLDSLKTRVADDESQDLRMQMKVFLESAERKMDELSEKRTQVDKSIEYLALYLCESPDQFILEDCFSTVVEFRDKFLKAVKEIDERKKKEARLKREENRLSLSRRATIASKSDASLDDAFKRLHPLRRSGRRRTVDIAKNSDEISPEDPTATNVWRRGPPLHHSTSSQSGSDVHHHERQVSEPRGHFSYDPNRSAFPYEESQDFLEGHRDLRGSRDLSLSTNSINIFPGEQRAADSTESSQAAPQGTDDQLSARERLRMRHRSRRARTDLVLSRFAVVDEDLRERQDSATLNEIDEKKKSEEKTCTTVNERQESRKETKVSARRSRFESNFESVEDVNPTTRRGRNDDIRERIRRYKEMARDEHDAGADFRSRRRRPISALETDGRRRDRPKSDDAPSAKLFTPGRCDERNDEAFPRNSERSDLVLEDVEQNNKYPNNYMHSSTAAKGSKLPDSPKIPVILVNEQPASDQTHAAPKNLVEKVQENERLTASPKDEIFTSERGPSEIVQNPSILPAALTSSDGTGNETKLIVNDIKGVTVTSRNGSTITDKSKAALALLDDNTDSKDAFSSIAEIELENAAEPADQTEEVLQKRLASSLDEECVTPQSQTETNVTKKQPNMGTSQFRTNFVKLKNPAKTRTVSTPFEKVQPKVSTREKENLNPPDRKTMAKEKHEASPRHMKSNTPTKSQRNDDTNNSKAPTGTPNSKKAGTWLKPSSSYSDIRRIRDSNRSSASPPSAYRQQHVLAKKEATNLSRSSRLTRSSTDLSRPMSRKPPRREDAQKVGAENARVVSDRRTTATKTTGISASSAATSTVRDKTTRRTPVTKEPCKRSHQAASKETLPAQTSSSVTTKGTKNAAKLPAKSVPKSSPSAFVASRSQANDHNAAQASISSPSPVTSKRKGDTSASVKNCDAPTSRSPTAHQNVSSSITKQKKDGRDRIATTTSQKPVSTRTTTVSSGETKSNAPCNSRPVTNSLSLTRRKNPVQESPTREKVSGSAMSRGAQLRTEIVGLGKTAGNDRKETNGSQSHPEANVFPSKKSNLSGAKKSSVTCRSPGVVDNAQSKRDKKNSAGAEVRKTRTSSDTQVVENLSKGLATTSRSSSAVTRSNSRQASKNRERESDATGSLRSLAINAETESSESRNATLPKKQSAHETPHSRKQPQTPALSRRESSKVNQKSSFTNSSTLTKPSTVDQRRVSENQPSTPVTLPRASDIKRNDERAKSTKETRQSVARQSQVKSGLSTTAKSSSKAVQDNTVKKETRAGYDSHRDESGERRRRSGTPAKAPQTSKPPERPVPTYHDVTNDKPAKKSFSSKPTKKEDDRTVHKSTRAPVVTRRAVTRSNSTSGVTRPHSARITTPVTPGMLTSKADKKKRPESIAIPAASEVLKELDKKSNPKRKDVQLLSYRSIESPTLSSEKTPETSFRPGTAQNKIYLTRTSRLRLSKLIKK